MFWKRRLNRSSTKQIYNTLEILFKYRTTFEILKVRCEAKRHSQYLNKMLPQVHYVKETEASVDRTRIFIMRKLNLFPIVFAQQPPRIKIILLIISMIFNTIVNNIVRNPLIHALLRGIFLRKI